MYEEGLITLPLSEVHEHVLGSVHSTCIPFRYIDQAGTSQAHVESQEYQGELLGPKRRLDRLEIFQCVRIGLPLEGYRMMRRELSYYRKNKDIQDRRVKLFKSHLLIRRLER
jgi:hypothetical protein